MIILKNNNLEAGVQTYGACLSYLRWKGIDILRPQTGGNKDPLQAACFPCVPYFGRIPKGVTFNNTFFPLEPTHKGASPDSAIHGEGWLDDWKITQQAEGSLEFQLENQPLRSGLYPFNWRAIQSISLSENEAALTLDVQNRNGQQAPFGLALHPFFPRSSITKVQFDYETIHTPPGFDEVNLSGHSFSKGCSLPNFTVDQSFVEWDGTLTLSTGDHQIRLKSNASNLHIYAPSGENYFCLEPIMQLPGAFGEQATLNRLLLAPNALRTLTLSIEII